MFLATDLALVTLEIFFLFYWISETVPRRFLLQTGSNTTLITRHHCHLFPTLSLEHLSLSLKSNLALHSLLTLS
jgi:hypothetical protein